MKQGMFVIAALLALLVVSAGSAEAQRNSVDAAANGCIDVTNRRSSGYPTLVLQLKNSCSYEVTVAWCVQDYHDPNTSSPPKPEKGESRNCSHPRAQGKNGWNPTGFYYTRSRIDPGETLDLYADAKNSGPAHYAACRSEVNGDRVYVRTSSTSDSSYGCYTY